MPFLPTQIIASYKYENGHIGPCVFNLKVKSIYNHKYCACYINQSRGDDYPRYLISFVEDSEQAATEKLHIWLKQANITIIH